MARKPLTRAQRRIAKAPLEGLRRVRLSEKLAHPEKFSLKGEYYVPKSVEKVKGRTAFVTVTRRRGFITGVSHSKAAKERAAGVRPYESAATEEQARKTRETFRLRREVQRAERSERPWRIAKGPRRGEIRWKEERVTDSAKQKYFEHRRRKLAGKWIEDGDWHEMMTVARAINDPMLNLLMKS